MASNSGPLDNFQYTYARLMPFILSSLKKEPATESMKNSCENLDNAISRYG